MIYEEEQILMSQYDFQKGEIVFLDYLDERRLNFVKKFDPWDVFTFFEMFLVLVNTATGKMTPMSPLFTALMPAYISVFLTGV